MCLRENSKFSRSAKTFFAIKWIEWKDRITLEEWWRLMWKNLARFRHFKLLKWCGYRGGKMGWRIYFSVNRCANVEKEMNTTSKAECKQWVGSAMICHFCLEIKVSHAENKIKKPIWFCPHVLATGSSLHFSC